MEKKTKGSKSRKQNNQITGALKLKKERKSKEAVERQKKYDTLTLDQKIAKCKPGSKEHTKLLVKKGT